MRTTSVNRREQQRAVRPLMGPWQRVLKRACDVVAALLGLAGLLPLLLVIGICLMVEGGGSVFYTQERIGLGGRPFRIIKFRTMRGDAEPDGPQLRAEDDSRMTRVGRFLCRYHLDELPQFWNVLVGDMSMVGPRPERQFFIEKIMAADPRYRYLFQVRPGVTSEATIYNGYTTTLDQMLERLQMDLHYMEHATLWSDFCIVVKTFRAMIRPSGRNR